MKTKKSAGLLLFRRRPTGLEVFLVHMGGPFWQHKDEGAWSIPKGELDEEVPLEAAKREFQEETGLPAPEGPFLELAPVRQAGGKTVFAWALEGDCEAACVKSNYFTMEWPKGSGLMKEFPEIDRAVWMPSGEARRKLLKGQVPLLDALEAILAKERPA